MVGECRVSRRWGVSMSLLYWLERYLLGESGVGEGCCFLLASMFQALIVASLVLFSSQTPRCAVGNHWVQLYRQPRHPHMAMLVSVGPVCCSCLFKRSKQHYSHSLCTGNCPQVFVPRDASDSQTHCHTIRLRTTSSRRRQRKE